MRYLILALLVLYVVWRWRSAPAAGSKAAGAAAPAAPEVIDMVVCAHCGVHLPVTQALAVQARYFCCRAHQDAAGA